MKPTTVKALFFASAVWITAAMTLMAQERSTTSVTPGTIVSHDSGGTRRSHLRFGQ